MKAKKLRMRILVPFDIIIVTFSLLVAVFGYYVIQKDIIERAQTKVKNDLNSAREIYLQEINRVKNVVRLTALRFFLKDAISENDRETLSKELDRIRKAESLDVLTLTDSSGKVVIRSRNSSVIGDNQADDMLVGGILSNRQVIAGTLIVPSTELVKEGEDLAERAHIKFISTPKAKKIEETESTSGMMIKAGAPVFGYDGGLVGILYGGSLINRDYKIVDKVKETVYRGETFKGKDVGTATIFQGDLRISTNVSAKDGSRAIGTRVSEIVNEQVLVKGLPWVARAFVVTDWYKTAYEPIRDIDGQIIGILYVGILEQPFNYMVRNILIVFFVIVAVAAALAASLEAVLTKKISQPLERMLKATEELSEGDLGYEVDTETGTIELDTLAASFNEMSAQLRARQESLKTINEKLEALNKTYLDLVGFVSHELKGIVATTIMNAAAVRDELFGRINPKQKKSLDSVTRNLNYLRETVKKFLDLSRIEKGELEVNRTELRLKEDVFDPCLEIFGGQIAERQMEVINNIAPEIKLQGDIDLLRIAANNLVGNAVKYGLDKGKVMLGSEDLGRKVQIEIYNDSRPVQEQEKKKLFKKFSRLGTLKEKKVKGTGLGLFITREIITMHGGDIWVEPKENGNSFVFQLEKDSETS
ncbi:MAG TPA: cache domain-containing protein [Sedimentisphaerales bacterium]|nr:cache domain-containing protein [Sedimentisphaerales bacterium]